MLIFRVVIHLFRQSNGSLYIAYREIAGSQSKKIPAHATLLLTMKLEVESPFNRISITYNCKGHRALMGYPGGYIL